MLRLKSLVVLNSLLALIALTSSTDSAFAENDVCSRGLGQPPFLSYGVDANLLLMLDNSGSMLDMAYINDTTVAADQTQCFDDTFKIENADGTPAVYAGNYHRLVPVEPPAVATETAWYKWVDGIELWQSGEEYETDDLVYTNGVVYRALSDGISTGTTIYTATGVEWERLLQPTWKPGITYRKGAFVISPLSGYMYHSINGGTSSSTATAPEFDTVSWTKVETWKPATPYTKDTSFVLWKNIIYQAISTGTSVGDAPLDDTGVGWKVVDSFAWAAATTYVQDDIVTFRGMIYQAKTPHTSVGPTLYDDTAKWTRIDEGSYQMIPISEKGTDGRPTVCTGASHKSTDICITMDTASDPDQVASFVATGNMLNWLMSSKFDIQKTILTGGKYNSNDQLLISENRGCSGSRFVKQVALNNAAGSQYYLTMAVRGARSVGDPMRDDRIDSTDDTTRVEVLAITTSGYQAGLCQDVINAYLEDGSLKGNQNLVDNCLDVVTGIADTSEMAKARDALNHGMQTCWQNDGDEEYIKHLKTNVDDCNSIYEDMTSGAIPSYSQAYNCYGIYDPYKVDTERTGYMGRCYTTGATGSGGICQPKSVPTPTSATLENELTCNNKKTICTFYSTPSGTTERFFMNDTSLTYSQYCSEFKSNGTCATWTLYSEDSITHELCVASTTPSGTDKFVNWSSDIDGTPGKLGDELLNDQNSLINGMDNLAAECVSRAMKDFCSGLTAPQVIDPTDQIISSSTSTYNTVPAQLIDSAVLSQLGIDVPLKVMKGYATQTTEPDGILQKNAENLRIGAMAFNKVGSQSECALQTTANDDIEQYCLAGDKDGAQVIAPVRSGMLLTDDQVGTANDRYHIDDVAEAVNLVRATAWTPLAEAIYNSIGYYTQNNDIRLYDGDFQTDKDVLAWVKNKTYAPGSYILENSKLYQTLFGGTTGSTTMAGDTPGFWTEIGGYRGSWANTTLYAANAIVRYNDKLYFTASGGTSKLKPEAALAGKSGPHFDEGVMWEPLLDPVVYSCQENHILVITEGASTADINSKVLDFINTKNIDDPTNDTEEMCTDGLMGSTYLDDLTYFARDQKDEFAVYPADNATLPLTDYPFTELEKNNLTTHIVVAGSLRGNATSTDECDPAVLMRNAAANGGTEAPVLGENPEKLEQQLTEIFNELRQRASAGSAASVISSARGGEGAIYQAIFWPELIRQDTQGKDWKVAWAGDVHGLFLDEHGYMYEDSNRDRTMRPSEDLDSDGRADLGEYKWDAGAIVINVDVNGDGTFSKTEDLNGNGVFDTGEDLDGDGHFDDLHEDVDGDGTWENSGDKRVIVYFDKDQQKSRACYNTTILQSLGVGCTPASAAVDLEQVKFLWSANDWLSDYPVDNTGNHSLDTLDTTNNRTSTNYISNARQRYIFTWNDLDHDGVVDYSDNEVKDLVESPAGWNAVVTDFNAVAGYEVNNIISWLRGKDWLVDEDLNANGVLDAGETDTVSGDGPLRRPLRSRQSVLTTGGTTTNFTWRLGDIIHSTPQTVAAPAEGYHLLYNDRTYAQFVSQYKKRRHVVYFGANDGMLHAVNAGFYSDIEKKFCLSTPQADGTCPAGDSTNTAAPALGTELWSYVPYNLQPHLKCLTSPLYSHKYFVDLKPRVFDAQIFKPDADHPYGWGTIMVGGLRFGGAPISAAEIDPTDTTKRQFISSYFIMDITNPEKPPILMGELSQELDAAGVAQWADLGFTTAIPTMVISKTGETVSTPTGTMNKTTTNKWYLVFGSGPRGPNGLKGVSDQQARVSVLPLGGVINSTTPLDGTLVDGFVDTYNKPVKAMRIPKGVPTVASPAGTFMLPPDPAASTPPLYGFVSDPITVDFDINPSTNQQYVSDSVYFGTVEGAFSTYAEGTPYWKGGGHLYRLVMEADGHTIGDVEGGGSLNVPNDPYRWAIKPMLDLSRTADASEPDGFTSKPITAAPSIGTDGHNYWLYFGTGRFFDPDDKTDRHQQSYYGLKEPATAAGLLNWNQVALTGSFSASPGSKGLLQVDEILVEEDTSSGSALLACRNNANDTLATSDLSCLPGNVVNFANLESYIAGIGTCTSTTADNCVDGWYRNFYPYQNRERNVGQATLLGGLVTYTTYQPFNDVCQAEGNSFLYGVYYKTGTSWYENVFGEYGIEYNDYVKNKLSLGRGLTSTPNLFVGEGVEGVKAFIQTSTGEIKEIKQENLPVKSYKTGRERWREYQRP